MGSDMTPMLMLGSKLTIWWLFLDLVLELSKKSKSLQGVSNSQIRLLLGCFWLILKKKIAHPWGIFGTLASSDSGVRISIVILTL